jgi:hypothetical protein
MFKKMNCKFTTGYNTVLTVNVNKITAIASSVEKPGWHYIYLGDNKFLIDDEQRKEIEKQLQSNLEIE